MIDKIILMNQNTPVAKITGHIIIKENSNIPQMDISNIEFLNKTLCPPSIFANDMEIRKKQFLHWFNKRLISDKRTDIPQKPIRFEGSPCFFSLSDQYWFKTNDNQNWNELNLINNKFDKTLGDIFFSKNLLFMSSTLHASYNTPDITTNGVLKKRWIKENGEFYLVKHMSKEYGQEPINEILASHLLRHLKIIDFVEYKLCIEGYDICSKCKTFITNDTEFVPAAYIYAATPISEKEKEIKAKDKNDNSYIYMHLMSAVDLYHIPHAKEFIDNMIIADRYMLNYDRHLGNFGFLRNVKTGEYLGPAPLFDFGNAFFSDEKAEVSKVLSCREKYLFDNFKIKPISQDIRNVFKNEIMSCFLLNDDEKRKIITKFENSNRTIAQEYHKMNDIYEEKTDKKGHVIQNAAPTDF